MQLVTTINEKSVWAGPTSDQKVAVKVQNGPMSLVDPELAPFVVKLLKRLSASESSTDARYLKDRLHYDYGVEI